MENPYDMSEIERIERDWAAERRAEELFLRDTYADTLTEFELEAK